MGSIFIIWGMVFGLDYAATMRIINLDTIEIKGMIMLVTAVVSLFCNMVSLAALGHLPLPACCKRKDKDGQA